MVDYTGVNWVAVVVAAVANIVIGFVYYLPQVMGNRWAAATGRTLPSAGQIAPMTYLGGVVVALVSAYVLALIIHAAGAKGITEGAIWGFLAWLGFVATTTYGGVLWEGRSTNWWAINAGATVITAVVMGAVIGYFG